MATPTVLQLQLGKELKRLREARGWTLAEAVEVLGNKATKLSRLENGQSSVRPLDIRVLYEALGAAPEETEWAVEIAKHCNQRGRWSGYRSVYGKFFRMAVDLTQDAIKINSYHTETMPGLLQTEDYMRSVFEAIPYSRETVDQGVKARLERQQVLVKPNPPEVSFILSESTLLRRVGDAAIMREQIEHVIDISTRPNIQVRVLPFESRTFPPGCMFPFELFTIRSHEESQPLEYVYVEDYDDGRYRDDRESVYTYSDLWRRFRGASLDPQETRAMLEQRVPHR
jgi:transcriptional regulator with XRE-family HTH domain